MDIYEPVDWRDTIPVEEIDLAQPRLFRDGMVDRLYTRLREEAPIHYCPESEFGPYWSITRHADIEAVALDASTFSSDIRHGGAAIYSNPGEPLTLPMFLRMDPPDHAVQRGAAAPAFSPAMMQSIEGDLRRRAGAILDGLPINQPIDWVSQVSAELTAMTLATLLDFPQNERHKLIRWSDVVTAMPGGPIVDTMEQKLSELTECFERFIAIWRERERSAPVPAQPLSRAV
jgi:cytochrome P450